MNEEMIKLFEVKRERDGLLEEREQLLEAKQKYRTRTSELKERVQTLMVKCLSVFLSLCLSVCMHAYTCMYVCGSGSKIPYSSKFSRDKIFAIFVKGLDLGAMYSEF